MLNFVIKRIRKHTTWDKGLEDEEQMWPIICLSSFLYRTLEASSGKQCLVYVHAAW
jgi:hypothetical protein